MNKYDLITIHRIKFRKWEKKLCYFASECQIVVYIYINDNC